MKTKLLLCGCALALGAGIGVLPAEAQGTAAKAPAPEVESVDLNKFQCRTLLKMTGDNRDKAVIFLHAYVSGEKKQTMIDLGSMTQATDKIIDYCIDHPATPALMAFAKNR